MSKWNKKEDLIIIHGAEEFGETTEEIKEADTQYVNDILEHMNVKVKPVSVVRLGKIEKGKHRTMKVVMPDKKSKENIMDNLCKLKGTGDTFE